MLKTTIVLKAGFISRRALTLELLDILNRINIDPHHAIQYIEYRSDKIIILSNATSVSINSKHLQSHLLSYSNYLGQQIPQHVVFAKKVTFLDLDYIRPSKKISNFFQINVGDYLKLMESREPEFFSDLCSVLQAT